jgi:hypothetical protein
LRCGAGGGCSLVDPGVRGGKMKHCTIANNRMPLPQHEQPQTGVRGPLSTGGGGGGILRQPMGRGRAQPTVRGGGRLAAAWVEVGACSVA